VQLLNFPIPRGGGERDAPISLSSLLSTKIPGPTYTGVRWTPQARFD
jgi:hypothetical protein